MEGFLLPADSQKILEEPTHEETEIETN